MLMKSKDYLWDFLIVLSRMKTVSKIEGLETYRKAYWTLLLSGDESVADLFKKWSKPDLYL